MPFPTDILNRIKANDPSLIEVSLPYNPEAKNCFILDSKDATVLAKVLTNNTHLQHVNLARHHVGIEGTLQILNTLKGNKSLKILDLGQNFVNPILPQELSTFFERLKQTNLIWINCGAYYCSSEFLFPRINNPLIKNLSNKTTADFRFVKLALSSFRKDYYIVEKLVDELVNENIITHLDLAGENIDIKESLEITRLLKTNKTLKALGLSNCSITNGGLNNIIEGLKQNNTLLRLNLSLNKITDESLLKLSELFSINRTLEALSLSSNQFKDISIFMQTLETSKIKELQLSRNDLNEKSISAIAKFIAQNSTCKILDLSDLDFCGQVNEILKALTLNSSLIDINLSWINSKYIARLTDTLKTNKTIKKLTLSLYEFGDDDFKLLFDALTKNYTLSEINLQATRMSLNSIIALRDALKNHPSIVSVKSNHLKYSSERGKTTFENKKFFEAEVVPLKKEIATILAQNQQAKNIEISIKDAEAILNQENCENENSKLTQALECYQKTFDRIEEFHKLGYPQYDRLLTKLYTSLVKSYLNFNMLEEAWQSFRTVKNPDSESYQKLAEAFINNKPCNTFLADNNKIQDKQVYQFILLLLKNAGNSQAVSSLITRVFQYLHSGSDSKGFLTIQELTGRDVVISLETLLKAAQLAKERLEELLNNNKINDDKKSHLYLLNYICTQVKIFDNEIIKLLCNNNCVCAELHQLSGVHTDQVAIIEQMIIQPEIFPLAPVDDVNNNPHANLMTIIYSKKKDQLQDIFYLCKMLENKLFEKMDYYYKSRIEDPIKNANNNSLNETKPHCDFEVVSNLEQRLLAEQYLIKLKNEILSKLNENELTQPQKTILSEINKAQQKNTTAVLTEALKSIYNIAKCNAHSNRDPKFLKAQEDLMQQWYLRIEKETKDIIDHLTVFTSTDPNCALANKN